MLLLIILFIITSSVMAQHTLADTWVHRDANKKVDEIFVMFPGGDFTANLFDQSNHPVAIESGRWFTKGDSIFFSFNEIISWKENAWKPAEPEKMKPVAASFLLQHDRLRIGTTLYMRKDY